MLKSWKVFLLGLTIFSCLMVGCEPVPSLYIETADQHGYWVAEVVLSYTAKEDTITVLWSPQYESYVWPGGFWDYNSNRAIIWPSKQLKVFALDTPYTVLEHTERWIPKD